MGIFGKRDKVVDLRGNYSAPRRSSRVQEKESSNSKNSEMSAFGFGNSSQESSSSEYVTWSSDKGGFNNNENSNGEDKKIKLTKRLLEMTDKLEDLSNQIYHMKQRLEIIEKKLKISYD